MSKKFVSPLQMMILTGGYNDGWISGDDEIEEKKPNIDNGEDTEIVLPDGGVVIPDGTGDVEIIAPENPDAIGIDAGFTADEAYY